VFVVKKLTSFKKHTRLEKMARYVVLPKAGVIQT